MYNRYIPQNDGTYRRSRVGDAPPPPVRSEPIREPSQNREPVCEPEAPPCRQGQPCAHMRPPRPVPPRPRTQPVGIGTFLKQLIPAGFDTEDLIIVLLLLLMAGDCQEDQNSALLTLVLYLFL